jgi:hypothetical protein
MQTVQRANSHYYQADALKRVGVFGTRDSFFAGLEAVNGRPVVGTDAEVLEQMRREFDKCADPRIRVIQTTNYGLVQTDLRTEWEFAECPVAGKVYPGQLGHLASSTSITISRTPIRLTELTRHAVARGARLLRAEVLALRLYTGPAYKVLNTALREDRFTKGKRDCPKNVHFDLQLLMDNVLELAGVEEWMCSWGAEWAHVWSSVAEKSEMFGSELFGLRMQEVMRDVALGPTTGVFINSSEKIVVVLAVTVEGACWHEWRDAGHGIYVERRDGLDYRKQRKAYEKLQREREREEKRRLEEVKIRRRDNEKESRWKYLSQKSAAYESGFVN